MLHTNLPSVTVVELYTNLVNWAVSGYCTRWLHSVIAC